MEDKEKQNARELIRVRDQGFPSPWKSVLGSKSAHWVRYLGVGYFVLILVTSWSDIPLRSFFLAGVGVILGAITKEMMMTKKSADNWLFIKTVIDWDKVSKIADLESEQDDPSDGG